MKIQYITENGVTARINFYGGLRDSQHAMDQHDADVSLRSGHAKRTLEVASHPTHINIHMVGPGEETPFLDIWMTRSEQKLKLSTLIFNTQRYDINSQLTRDDHVFSKLNVDLGKAMKALMSMVPNPYSPK